MLCWTEAAAAGRGETDVRATDSKEQHCGAHLEVTGGKGKNRG